MNWCLDPEHNRVVQYLKGTIEVTYATTLTGWHGNKALGFTITCDDNDHSVVMSAPDVLEQLGKRLLKASATMTPKHIMTKDFFNIPKGAEPDRSNPDYDSEIRGGHPVRGHTFSPPHAFICEKAFDRALSNGGPSTRVKHRTL